MTDIKIGVIGGIGPEASAEFYSKLIMKLQQSGKIKKNTDFPQIIINSIPAPELIYDKISQEDLEPYKEGLEELDRFGCDFIAMVCNTIHLYCEDLQKCISTPILNLREEVRKLLMKSSVESALILGTPNTIRQGLYRFESVTNFEPNEEELELMTEAIFNFNKGYEKEKQAQSIKEICEKYLNKGAKTVLLGCTEFAVMLEKEKFPKINTIDVLVDAVVDNLNKPEPIIKKKR